jgi:branched-chain amino acid transport system ATP-binding protein
VITDRIPQNEAGAKGDAMLDLEGVSKEFGGLAAVSGVSLSVAAGTITGLIGPNGAGKTTLFNMLAGSFAPSAGAIRFAGRRIDGLPAHRVFAAGLVRTFQIPRPFAEMTVLENLMLVPRGQSGERFWNNWLRPARVRAEERRHRERAKETLDFLGLTRLADEPARILSGGQRKLLEIGRALMAEPRLMLLDEPGAGVNPTLLGEIVDRIAALNARGLTFLVIEHNMELIQRLCRPVIVMAGGRVLMEGTADEVRRDPRVLDAYLGGRPA